MGVGAQVSDIGPSWSFCFFVVVFFLFFVVFFCCCFFWGGVLWGGGVPPIGFVVPEICTGFVFLELCPFFESCIVSIWDKMKFCEQVISKTILKSRALKSGDLIADDEWII